MDEGTAVQPRSKQAEPEQAPAAQGLRRPCAEQAPAQLPELNAHSLPQCPGRMHRAYLRIDPSVFVEFIILESAILESTILESTILESTILESIVLESTILESIVLESIVLESIVLEFIILESIVLEFIVLESIVLADHGWIL